VLDRRAFVLSAAAFGCASRAAGGNVRLELVMVEEPGCPWCARWNAEIGPIYPKSAEGRLAPLRRIDIRAIDPDALAVAQRVVFTPTFILARDGTEIGRIEGYPGEELFWWFLAALMNDNDLTIGGETK
jgi:thioredoxin-related protein